MRTQKQIALITGLIAASLVFGATDAMAQRGGRGHGGGRGWMRAVKSLDLSQAQVQKIAQARADMVTKTAPVRAQIDIKSAQLRALWQAKSPSRQAIIAKSNEIDTLHRQVRDARIGFKLRVFGVLTPAQRTTLQKRIAAGPPAGGCGKGWGRGGGRGRGHGGGGGGGGRGGW